MSTVENDKAIGDAIEKAWGQFVLNTYPVSEVTFSSGNVPGWDLKLTSEEGRAKFHEVKFDQSSAAPWLNYKGEQRRPTGNLFIEYKNPKMGRPSGIMVTRSDWWIYIVKQAYELVTLQDVNKYKAKAYIIHAQQLKDFLNGEHNLRSVPTVRDTVNGRVNAEGWLLPIHTLKSSGILFYEEDFTSYIRALFSSTL
jgi:hypothetical protein